MIELRLGDGTGTMGGSRGQDVFLAVCCAFFAVIATGLPLLWEPRFFYTDDYQTYFLPMYHEVARLLSEGHFPLITDRLWRSGALLAEYQVAVLNPVSLALYVLMSKINSAPAAAAVYSLFHIGIFAAGTYFMCRVLRCKPSLAVMAAVTAPTSEWLLYWGATNWIPALVSMAWMPWAIGSLLRLYDSRGWFIPAAASVALVGLSGWPFALLAFLVVAAVVWLATLPWQLKGNFKRCSPIYLALLAGALLSAPAVLPMFPYVRYSERPFDPGTLWRTSLAGLSAIGMPFHKTSWHAFDQVRVVALPMTYVAWFIPVVLANAGLRRMLKTPTEAALLVAAVWFACLSTLPMLGHFRWMFRLLPYYHFALIVLTAVVLSRPREAFRFSLFPTALAVLVPFAISIVTVPSLVTLYAFSALLVVFLIVMASVFAVAAPAALVSAAIFSNVVIVWSINYSVVSGGYPIYPSQFRSPFSNDAAYTSSSPKRHLAIFSRPELGEPGAFWYEFRPGNTSLFSNVISINGYSPFDPKPYRKLFCFDYLSAVWCNDVINRLTRPVDGFGVNILDITRTEVVDIQSPEVAAQFRRAVSGEWQSNVTSTGATVFSRVKKPDGPLDPISWQPQGVRATVVERSPRHVVIDVENGNETEVSLVIARAWYPDWHAQLDGVELTVDVVEGFVVRVKLPPRASGRLILDYWPAGLSIGLSMAAVGAMMMFASLALPRAKRVRRRSAHVNL